MSHPLPEDVQAAIQRGDTIKAIQLLRERTGLGLADAKAAVERGSLTAPARATQSDLPPEVKAALASGKTIEAIKSLREATGLGLKEAKDAVDAYRATHPSAQRLASGEVPRRRFGLGFLALLIVAALLGWMLLRS